MKWFIIIFLFHMGFEDKSIAFATMENNNIKTQSKSEDVMQDYCPQLEQIEQYFVCRGESTIEECIGKFNGQVIVDLLQSVMKKLDAFGADVFFCVKNPMCLWNDTISECKGQIEEAAECILESIRGFYETHCLTQA